MTCSKKTIQWDLQINGGRELVPIQCDFNNLGFMSYNNTLWRKKKKNLQRVNLSFISACVYNGENLKNNWSDKHQEVEEAGEKIIVA